MTVYGYARVSTREQSLDIQELALKDAGCEKIYGEKVSGASKSRPQLLLLLDAIQPGDKVIVTKLDRLGRNLSHLIQVVEEFQEMEVDFISLQDGLNTTTPSGQLIFHIMGALAQFEREMIRERVQAGIDHAKANGIQLGRPKAIDYGKAKSALKLLASGSTQKEVCRILGFSRTSLHRLLKQVNEPDFSLERHFLGTKSQN